MIKVLIVDDHPIVRNGIKQIIADEKDMKVCCEAADTEEAIDKLKKHEVDVIVLDLCLPGQNGLDALILIKQLNNKIPILILSALPEELYAKRSIEAGASGFMHKESATEELALAIRKIYSGGKYASRKFAEQLIDELVHSTGKKPHENLSQREFQILLQLGSGKPVSRIAEKLNLSVNTVSTYRKRVLEKMKLDGNSAIISYCLKEKLIN